MIQIPEPQFKNCFISSRTVLQVQQNFLSIQEFYASSRTNFAGAKFHLLVVGKTKVAENMEVHPYILALQETRDETS